MHTIENNPFRILCIISNASAKETNESETFILRYLDIGKSANLKFDITPPLRPLSRTSEIVKNAKRSIHDDFDKLTHSIFWFVNGTMVDKIALEKLSSEMFQIQSQKYRPTPPVLGSQFLIPRDSERNL